MASKQQTDPSADAATRTGLPPRRRGRVLIGIVLHVVLPLAVLGVGALLTAFLITTGPEAAQKQPDRRATLVDVEVVAFGRHGAIVRAMGTVVPARVIDLHPRVSGEITDVGAEFLPGGRFGAGETMIQIDREDYELAVERNILALDQSELAVQRCDLAIEQKQSDVARTEGELKLELGQQAVAKREYELLGETVSEDDKELVLRQPQLRTVRAEEQAAKAALKDAEVAKRSAQTAIREAQNAFKQARLDLQRTAIRAPFNAVVRSRDVNLGATVTPSTRLATLVGTDAYWVEVSVPVDQLKWIAIPQSTAEKGAAVRVQDEAAWGAGVFRTGRVCRLTSDLEERGRMARLLVSIDDPLALEADNRGKPTVLIGSYVRVEIEGTELESAAPISRRLLRDGHNVWIMNADNRLEIRPVTVAFRSRDRVLVTEGVRPGERLVTTDLPAPVEGMPLRTRADGPSPPAAAGEDEQQRPAGEAKP